MSFVNAEAILQAKKMDLLTNLQNYEPNELVHVSGDSVHIMIVQMVVRLTFEPQVECRSTSAKILTDIGQKQSALDAAVECNVTRERCWKMPWIIELDIKGLFDNIDHELTGVLICFQLRRPPSNVEFLASYIFM